MGQRAFLRNIKFVNIMANLKEVEYFLLAIFGCFFMILITGIRHPLYVASILLLTSYLFVRVLNSRLRTNRIKAKWNRLIDDQSNPEDGQAQERLIKLKQESLEYCSELIDYYQTSRRLNRRLYYTLQIGIIVLTAITPIVALIAQNSQQSTQLEIRPLVKALISINPTQDIDINHIVEVVRWIPVLLPAIAAILASISTAFPFQESWIKSNITGELLERV